MRFEREDARLKLGLDGVVDMSTILSMPTSQKNRRIVGFSLSPELAREVKTEAASRGVSLRKLFEEMWADYKSTKARP